MHIIKFDKKNIDYKHLIIKGDNLDVMPSLYSTKVKVDLVYIDIPYNSTNDKYYVDDKNSLAWAEDIEKRLMLLVNTIKETGFIGIHIDNNEKSNLIKICNKIFGYNNYVGELITIVNPAGRSDSKFIARTYDSIIVYAKNIRLAKNFKLYVNNVKLKLSSFRKTGSGDKLADRPAMWYPIFYNKFDIIKNKETYDIFTINPSDRDLYLNVYKKLGEKGAVSFMINNIIPKYIHKNNNYDFILPTKSDGSNSRWRWGLETFIDNIQNNLNDCYVKISKNGKNVGISVISSEEIKYIKNGQVKKVINNGKVEFLGKKHFQLKDTLKNSEIDGESFSNATAKTILKNRKISSKMRDMSTPKSKYLMRDFILSFCPKDGHIMDIYGGSMATLDGTILANDYDNGDRRFIGVTDNQNNSFEDLTRVNVKAMINEYGLNEEDILFGELDEKLVEYHITISAFNEITSNKIFFQNMYKMTYIDEDNTCIKYKNENGNIFYVAKDYGGMINKNFINNDIGETILSNDSTFIKEYIKIYNIISEFK